MGLYADNGKTGEEKKKKWKECCLRWDDDDEKESDRMECGTKMHNQEMEVRPESTRRKRDLSKCDVGCG